VNDVATSRRLHSQVKAKAKAKHKRSKAKAKSEQTKYTK